MKLHRNAATKFAQKLVRDTRGVAEVIGGVLFIIILLFFFTNVYLWHDAATKQMNDLYVAKMNSPIVVSAFINATGNNAILNVTNRGGVDAELSFVWLDVMAASPGPDLSHNGYNASQLLNGQVTINPGNSLLVPLQYVPAASSTTLFTVVTTVGNLASIIYSPPP